MPAPGDESIICSFERELAGDEGLSDALAAFGDQPSEQPRVRRSGRMAVTALAAVITIVVIASGHAGHPFGALVMLGAALLAVDAQRSPRSR